MTRQSTAAAQAQVLENVPSPPELRKKIITLAWPVMAEHALGTITHIVDMAMVGRVGAEAIAAIGLSIQPFFLAMSIFGAVSIGNTALVARFIGANDRESASHTLGQSLIMATIMAAIIAIVAFFFAEPIIGIMRPEPEVLKIGASYVRIMVPGFFFMLSGMMIAGSLRGAGDTKTPMKIGIMINILNPILNYVFIFGKLGLPAMGVQGAALATTLARSLGGIIFLWIIFRGKTVLHLKKKNLDHFDWDMLRRITRIGFPAAIEQVITRTGQMLFARTVASLGTLVYAAHAIAINAESISYMPAFGFAAASTALVGQNLGAERPQEASRSGWEAWKLGSIFVGVMAILLFVIPQYLMMIYTSDPDIIGLGVTCLRIIAFAQIPMATSFILSGGLRGAGDTKFMLYISTTSTWLVRLGLATLFVRHFGWGLTGAWLAMTFDWFFRAAVAAWRFQSGRWQKIKV